MNRPLSSRWRAFVAFALIALTAGLSLGPVLHAGDGHDVDCDPVVVVHDPSQHAFASGARAENGSLPAHEHCVTCHLFRISRLSQNAGLVPLADQTGRTLVSATDFSLHSRFATLPVPARAPPV